MPVINSKTEYGTLADVAYVLLKMRCCFAVDGYQMYIYNARAFWLPLPPWYA